MTEEKYGKCDLCDKSATGGAVIYNGGNIVRSFNRCSEHFYGVKVEPVEYADIWVNGQLIDLNDWVFIPVPGGVDRYTTETCP